ncbi:MAG: hypothetical protein J6J31_13575 [Thermoguttaceae bacterium]|nr:hypothetical protein [Thermoguttaceae bacterium]
MKMVLFLGRQDGKWKENAAHSPEQELQSEIVPECGFILLFRTFGNRADFF